MDNNNHHVLRNISFADTDEIYIIKDDEIEIGSGMGESLADLTPEPLPTKNNIFSETINIDFVNGELPETNYKSQKIEYEELSSETILLD